MKLMVNAASEANDVRHYKERENDKWTSSTQSEMIQNQPINRSFNETPRLLTLQLRNRA